MDRVTLPIELVNGKRLKCVEIGGGCMRPALANGDIAFFDADAWPHDGDIVCVTVKDTEEVLVKYWYRVSQEEVDLVPRVEVPGIGSRHRYKIDDLTFEGVYFGKFELANGPEMTAAQMVDWATLQIAADKKAG